MAQKIWFITGISRGLGRSLAKAALERGDTVIGTSRRGASDLTNTVGEFHVLSLDVSHREQVFSVVAQAHALHGRLDVVVNNAGYGLFGSVESSPIDEVANLMDTNFFGPLHVIQAALPLLRKQGSGHIVNISSIAGINPATGGALYGATKFALEGMALGLQRELAPLGIQVTTVEPGMFRTEFLTDASIRKTQDLPIYDSTCGETLRYLAQSNGKQIGDPERGAAAILKAVDSAQPPVNLFLGSDALKRARTRLEQLTQTLNEWESVSLSTDFPA